MGEWQPTTLRELIRYTVKRVPKLNRMVVGATNAADEAQSAADEAAEAARLANEAALEAAGIAEGKGKVYPQNDPPAVVDPNGLWIDTNDGNKPYRGVDLGPDQITNVLPNPAFRKGLNGYSTEPVISATQQPDGSVRVITTDGQSQSFVIGGVQGAEYTLVLVARSYQGGLPAIYGGIPAGQQIPLTDTYATYYLDFTQTDQNGNIYLAVVSPGGQPGGGFDLRSLMLVSGHGFRGAYGDGSTPGWSWSGSPDASSSSYTGPRWVPVQDAAIQAAADAAVAAGKAAQAAKDAADRAQQTADQAKQSADAAAAAASGAVASANGKNTIKFRIAAPSTTAADAGKADGDLWFVIPNVQTGVVTGQYTWMAATQTWVQQTLSSAVLASIDAGKITTGTLVGITITGVTITGATVTGGVVQTSATGKRVALAGNQLRFYGLKDDGVTAVAAGYIEGNADGDITINNQVEIGSLPMPVNLANMGISSLHTSVGWFDYQWVSVLKDVNTGKDWIGDTGWTPMNISSTLGTSDSTNPPRYRLWNQVVYFDGLFTPNSNTIGSTLITLDSIYRPHVARVALVVRGATASAPTFWMMRVQATGGLALLGPSGSGSGAVDFGGFPPYIARQQVTDATTGVTKTY